MGCLGLISIENGLWYKENWLFDNNPCFIDTFLAVVTSAAEIGNTRPSAIQAENVARIHEVCFYSLTSGTWDELPAVDDSFGSPDTTESTYMQECSRLRTSMFAPNKDLVFRLLLLCCGFRVGHFLQASYSTF
jgi:hypothetical protein